MGLESDFLEEAGKNTNHKSLGLVQSAVQSRCPEKAHFQTSEARRTLLSLIYRN